MSAFCAIGFAISFSAFADTLGSWAIPSSGALTTISSSANLGGVNIGPLTTTATGGGVNIAGFGGTGYATTTTVSVGTSKNISFSVSANAGYDVVINGVDNFQAYNSASGPNIWTLFWSTSSSFTTSTQIAQVSGTFNTLQTQNMTTAINLFLETNPITVKSGNTVYFRLVGNQSFSSGGSGRIPSSTVSILGTVAVAPIANLVWNGGASGLWNYDTANMVWLEGSTSISFIAGSIANVNSSASLDIDSAGVNAGALTNSIASGTTIITGGNLTSGSIINTGAGNLDLQVTNSAATLANNGTGTLSLSAPGTYAAVNVTNGTIQALTNAALSGLVNVSDGGTLNVSATSSNTIGFLTVSNGVVIGTGILTGSGSSFTLDSSDQTVPVSIQGTGNLTKVGSKTLTLSGANTFSGDVNLNVGTLATSGDDRLPDTTVVTMSANTILSLGGNETIKSLSASSANASAQVNLQSYILTMNVTASNQFVGSLVGTGSMVKNGSSILTLTNTSTYTGGTTMNAGSLRLQASGNKTINLDDNTVTLTTSPFGVGALNWAGGAIYSSSTSTSRNIYNAVNLLGGAVTLGDTNSTTGTGDMIVSADVTGVSTTLNANCTVNAAAAVDWEQPILGSGFNLSKGGTNKLTLRSINALSTLSVLAGILDARGSNSIGQVNVAGEAALAYAVTNTPFGAAAINLSNGAIFGQSATIGTTLSDRTISNQINVLGNVSFGIGAYTGSGGFASHLSGNVDLGGANRTLTIANSTYFYGAITNGGMNVTRTTTDLSSTKTNGLYGANSYSGGTTVNGSVDYVNNPILQLGNDSALGSGDLTLAGGGSLIVKAVSKADDIYNASRIITNSISIASGVSGVFDAGTNIVTSSDGLLVGIEVTNNMTLRGMVSGQGSLVKTNSGSLTLAGALSYGGGTTVADGNLIVVKTNLTTTISSNTVFIAMSNNVVAGTYPVLPGELTGTYPAATYSGPTGATATFNETTGSVTVTTVGPVTDGYALYLSSIGLPAGTAFDAKLNGVTVGLKYAFGSANGMPQNNGVTALPVMSGNQLTYTFDVKDDSALTVKYQTSSDLVIWTSPQDVSLGSGAAPSGFLRKQAEATGLGKLFFRINVTR